MKALGAEAIQPSLSFPSPLIMGVVPLYQDLKSFSQVPPQSSGHGAFLLVARIFQNSSGGAQIGLHLDLEHWVRERCALHSGSPELWEETVITGSQSLCSCLKHDSFSLKFKYGPIVFSW